MSFNFRFHPPWRKFRVVTMAELFWVGSASRTGKMAIARAELGRIIFRLSRAGLIKINLLKNVHKL